MKYNPIKKLFLQSVYKEISSRRQSRDTFTTHLKVSRDDDIFSAQRQHSGEQTKKKSHTRPSW